MLQDCGKQLNQKLVEVFELFNIYFYFYLTLKKKKDYVHIFFAHIAALVEEHGGLKMLSNQSVEASHKISNHVIGKNFH